MTTESQKYSVDQEIIDFFQQTSTDRSSCDDRAQSLVGGTVTPVAVQGCCSYSVYAGPNHEFVVQFRLKSLALKTETTTITSKIYGSLVPSVSYHGQIGEDGVDGKEPVSVYVMSRVKGISHLDFILAQKLPEDSPEYFPWRDNLISDMARFFALTWKNPQHVDPSYCDHIYQRYEKDLRRLLAALPDRFHPIIQQSINALPAIFSLPMVLLHEDFGVCNVMVDADDNHLVGIIEVHGEHVDPSYCDHIYQRYEKDLRRLLAALPDRFHPIIQQSINALPAIFSLPMVLLHEDFGVCNVMVDADDNHLVGIIDWAEAEIGPFGINLHSLQQFMSNYRLGVGWIRHGDYDSLDNNFWSILSAGAGLTEETVRTIKSAMIVGLLLSDGFTSRLANMPSPEPIRDDESGACKMLGLDGLLIVPATKIVD